MSYAQRPQWFACLGMLVVVNLLVGALSQQLSYGSGFMAGEQRRQEAGQGQHRESQNPSPDCIPSPLPCRSGSST